MKLDDILFFIQQNQGRWLPTVANEAEFQVAQKNSALKFTLQGGGSRNESFKWMETSLDLYNATGSLKKKDYPHSQNTSYVLGLFWAVAQPGLNLEEPLPAEEKEVLAAPITEREELRKSRGGQGKFRKDVIKLRGACYVTGLHHSKFLRASHIKPWADSNNAERLDKYNGLLLAPNYDSLFDQGHISFEDDGGILISPQIPKAVIDAFGINVNFRGVSFGVETQRYLSFHREKCFQAT